MAAAMIFLLLQNPGARLCRGDPPVGHPLHTTEPLEHEGHRTFVTYRILKVAFPIFSESPALEVS